MIIIPYLRLFLSPCLSWLSSVVNCSPGLGNSLRWPQVKDVDNRGHWRHRLEVVGAMPYLSPYSNNDLPTFQTTWSRSSAQVRARYHGNRRSWPCGSSWSRHGSLRRAQSLRPWQHQEALDRSHRRRPISCQRLRRHGIVKVVNFCKEGRRCCRQSDGLGGPRWVGCWSSTATQETKASGDAQVGLN